MKKETKIKAKKAMTIEDLAIITQRGLEGIESRMITVDSRFDEVNSRFDEVNSRFEEVDSRITNLVLEQKETNRRLAAIERKQLGTVLSLDETVHRNEFNGIVRRVEALEHH